MGNGINMPDLKKKSLLSAVLLVALTINQLVKTYECLRAQKIYQ